MSATICGHERDALTYVLNVAASDHNNPTADPLQSWDVLCYRLGPNDVQVDYSTGLLINRGKRTDLDASVIAAKRVGAWLAIHDPAKLAELMAAAMAERGVLIIENGDDPGDDMRFPAAEVFVENGTVAMHLYKTWKDCENEPPYTERPLPTTRAALQRILELHEGATPADAMKALRADYTDPDELLNTIPATKSLARRQNESNPGRRR